MLIRRLTLALEKQLCEYSFSQHKLFAQTARTYGVDHEKKQYQWREKEMDLEVTKYTDDPEKPKKFLWFRTSALKETDFSIGNILKWFDYHKLMFTKHTQQFIPERHNILGPDLATAHFLLHRGGRVKFSNNSHWMEPNKIDIIKLPNKFVPHYILEAIDINGFDLHYEGLSNLCSLTKLKWLSLKDCKNIDDWGLDKISAEFPELEYLNISGCEKITERGLESLYRMFNLKTLIVTNHHKSVAFELTCFMLEDCISGLTCKIHEPEKKLEE